MFPWVYGFHWSAFYVTFLCVFMCAATIVVITVSRAFLRTRRDFTGRLADGVIWKATFGDLTAEARACRHSMTGEMAGRICPNGFDCRSCVTHNELCAAAPDLPSAGSLRKSVERIAGFALPLDRYYHRGHTWARPEADGTYTVGLDGLGERLAGPTDRVDLPPVGAKVSVNGTAWEFVRGRNTGRVLSPVDGEVIEHGEPSNDWFLRVKPVGSDMKHLLRGGEVKPWMTREIERLETLTPVKGLGATLADGGALVEDIPASLKVDPDLLWGEMFMEA